MSEIEELSSRIMAAMDRVASGIDALGQSGSDDGTALRVAKHLGHELGRTVDDLWMALERAVAGNEPCKFDHSPDSIEIAAAGLDLGQNVQGAKLGGFLGGGQIGVAGCGCEMAGPDTVCVQWHLAGDEDQVSGPDEWNVSGDGGHGCGQGESQLRQSRFTLSGHVALPVLLSDALWAAMSAGATGNQAGRSMMLSGMSSKSG